MKLDLAFAISAGQPDTDAELALIRKDWQQIGVALDIRHYPPHLMCAPAQQGGVINGNAWDLTTFAWAADPLGDYSGNLGCDQFPPAGGNTLRWCNKKAQAAMDALVEDYDPAQRRADLKIVMQQVVRDVPMMVLDIREDMFAYNRDLKNYHPNDMTIFDNMMDVDI